MEVLKVVRWIKSEIERKCSSMATESELVKIMKSVPDCMRYDFGTAEESRSVYCSRVGENRK